MATNAPPLAPGDASFHPGPTPWPQHPILVVAEARRLATSVLVSSVSTTGKGHSQDPGYPPILDKSVVAAIGNGAPLPPLPL